MNKKLSVVIPTLNRYQYLKRTLDYIIPQVQENIAVTELVICCNASKDETDEYVKSILPQYPFIKYKYFDEYVEVGQSLIRSVSEATGEYVVLWGDDDIPMPFFVSTVLNILCNNPNLGVIYVNRLSGKDTKYDMKDMQVVEPYYYESKEGLMPISDLVQSFTINLGFISSLIFNKEGWDKGTGYYNPKYYGYEHLSIIINGNKGKDCYYYPYPVEIQRLPYNRDFEYKWPLYRFIGVPNMMQDFDKAGVTQGALDKWHEMRNSSTLAFIWNMAYTSLNRKMYKPLCKEINQYQPKWYRKVLTYVIIYILPKSVFSIIKKRIYM